MTSPWEANQREWNVKQCASVNRAVNVLGFLLNQVTHDSLAQKMSDASEWYATSHVIMPCQESKSTFSPRTSMHHIFMAFRERNSTTLLIAGPSDLLAFWERCLRISLLWRISFPKLIPTHSAALVIPSTDPALWRETFAETTRIKVSFFEMLFVSLLGFLWTIDSLGSWIIKANYPLDTWYALLCVNTREVSSECTCREKRERGITFDGLGFLVLSFLPSSCQFNSY